jgi:ribosomal protein S18 acetylase RimI-like enzyme
MNRARRPIRPYRASDELAVADVWHRSGKDAYGFLPSWQAFALEQAQEVFREVILPGCDIWVATLGEEVVAYLATKGSYIDRLYVDPLQQGCGWGSSLVDFAKKLHPDGLELHTHQENETARAFYEKREFTAVGFGFSPPPESAPDVEYHWRPRR